MVTYSALEAVRHHGSGGGGTGWAVIGLIVWFLWLYRYRKWN